MAMDAQTRHALHLRLDELVGADLAAMMSAYPPFDWSEVATKSDLRSMEDRLMGAMHRELNAQTKALVFSMAGLLIGVAGGASALSQILG